MQALATHEMVARALKHILQSVIAMSAHDKSRLAAAIASTFNVIFGLSSRLPAVTPAGQSEASCDPAAGACISSAREPSSGAVETAGAVVTGSGDSSGEEQPCASERERVQRQLWQWVRLFVRLRFNWQLGEQAHRSLRMLSLLRTLCLKVRGEGGGQGGWCRGVNGRLRRWMSLCSAMPAQESTA